MIILRASTEFMTDIFTPGVFSPSKCVEGLPKDTKLVNVEFSGITNTVTFYYDDGKDEETVVVAKYSAVIPGVESV